MSESLTLAGVTFTITEFADRGWLDQIEVNGATYNRILGLFAAGMQDLGKALNTTSSTSHDVSTGAKVFAMAEAVPFAVGAVVKISQTSAPTTNWMIATVTARSGTSLTVSVAAGDTQGSGTGITDWTISISGPTGEANSAISGTAAGPIAMDGNPLTGIGGTTFEITDIGNISPAWTIAEDAGALLEGTLYGDEIITVADATAGTAFSKLVLIRQDTVGGRVPIFEGEGSPNSATWIGTAVAWDSRPAEAWDLVSVLQWPGLGLFLSHIKGSS